MKYGIFKSRAILGSEQTGDSANGHPQMSLTFRQNIGDGMTQDVTVILIFSANSAPYSFERLRLCGWEGDDLTNLKGIDKNEVDVRVWEEMFDNKPQRKAEIVGGSRFEMAKPTTKAEFAAKVRAITGAGGGGGAVTSSTKPPF